MTNHRSLTIDIADHIATVTLIGPGRGNAMGPDFWREMAPAAPSISGNAISSSGSSANNASSSRDHPSGGNGGGGGGSGCRFGGGRSRRGHAGPRLRP